MGIKAVLVTNIGGEHLVDTARWLINEPLLEIQYLDPLRECRTHPHHIISRIENDECLLTVGGAAVDLGAFLTVTAGEQQSYSCGKLRLALLLGNLDICRIELPIAVGLKDTEKMSRMICSCFSGFTLMESRASRVPQSGQISVLLSCLERAGCSW